MSPPSRRQVLGALGVALAGCSDGPAVETADPERSTVDPDRTTIAPGTPRTSTSGGSSLPRTGPPPGGVDAFDDAIPAFMRDWDVPGASVAAVDGGRLVFARGYGFADRETGTPVAPDALFRIGSLSKPLTALGTLTLVEDGALALSDRVADVLAEHVPDGGPGDERVAEVTVGQLLRHTAGIDSGEIGFDPAFEPARVADATGTDPPADADALARFVLDQPLGTDPGSRFQYENAGYCLLGRVIEAASGAPYEASVRERVLEPLGAGGMSIGETRREGRRDGEVRYHGHDTVDSPFPDGGTVPRPYGVAHLPAIDAAGGWVGSAVDLLRIARGIDGRESVPDVLAPETVETLTARPAVPQWDGSNQYYGAGWYVIPGDEGAALWHNGSLPGSYGFLLYDRGSDRGVAMLCNARSADARFRQFNAVAQRTLLEAFRAVETWPDRDLFGEFA